MDIEYICQVVPVVEFAHDLQIDLEVEQKGFPHCFKTHFWYPHCPKGGKYIWCVREPCACAYSYFKMFVGWLFQPVEVSVEDFIRNICLPQVNQRDQQTLPPTFIISQAGGHTEMTQMFYWCFMKTSKGVMRALFALLLSSWASQTRVAFVLHWRRNV